MSVETEMTVEECRDEYAWMFRGLCRDVDPGGFFPSDGLGVELAQRVCAECPVKTECLDYALLHRLEHGVWAARPNANVVASSGNDVGMSSQRVSWCRQALEPHD